jgi:hypothetical protein
MKTSSIRASLLLIPILSLATFEFAQAQNNTSPALDKSKCQGCVSKVFRLPDSTKPYESQDVVNLFRTVVELTVIQQDTSQHTIAISGSPQQVAVAEKLVAALERLRSAGDRPISVLVYKPQQSTGSSSSEGPRSPADRELMSSYITAFYRPNSSMQQMQTLTESLRSSAHILRLQQLPSSHVIVVRGTSDQVTQAEGLINE